MIFVDDMEDSDPLADSNKSADRLTKMIALPQVELVQHSYAEFHHQNSGSLRKQFGLTRETACQIVKQCDVHPTIFSCTFFGSKTLRPIS